MSEDIPPKMLPFHSDSDSSIDEKVDIIVGFMAVAGLAIAMEEDEEEERLKKLERRRRRRSRPRQGCGKGKARDSSSSDTSLTSEISTGRSRRATRTRATANTAATASTSFKCNPKLLKKQEDNINSNNVVKGLNDSLVDCDCESGASRN